MVSVIDMPKKRGEPLVQKVFMIPVSLLEKLQKAAQKEGKSESEVIREALRVRLAS